MEAEELLISMRAVVGIYQYRTLCEVCRLWWGLRSSLSLSESWLGLTRGGTQAAPASQEVGVTTMLHSAGAQAAPASQEVGVTTMLHVTWCGTQATPVSQEVGATTMLHVSWGGTQTDTVSQEVGATTMLYVSWGGTQIHSSITGGRGEVIHSCVWRPVVTTETSLCAISVTGNRKLCEHWTYHWQQCLHNSSVRTECRSVSLTPRSRSWMSFPCRTIAPKATRSLVARQPQRQHLLLTE